MNSDNDFEKLAELLDSALTSNDPRVKTTLGHLLMIVSLTHGGGSIAGPFKRMIDRITSLEVRIRDLELKESNVSVSMRTPPFWISTTTTTATPSLQEQLDLYIKNTTG